MSKFLIHLVFSLISLTVSQACLASFDIVEVETPKHGLKAWCLHDETTEIVSLAIGFEGGENNTSMDHAGITPLLVQMLLKGAGPWGEKSLSKKLDHHGANLSFFSESDFFYIKISAPLDELRQVADLFKAIMTDSHFKKKALKKSVKELENRYKDSQKSPSTKLSAYMKPLLFGDHPLGRSAEAFRNSLQLIKKKHLRNYMKTRFARDNTTIAVVGALPVTEVSTLIDDIFAYLPAQSNIPRMPYLSPQCDGKVHYIDYPQEQSDITFMQPGLPLGHSDSPKLHILVDIMASINISRLYSILRLQKALTYHVGANVVASRHTGAVEGHLSVEPKNRDLAIAIIREEWTKLRDEGITQVELERIVKNLIEELPFVFSSSSHTAEYLLVLLRQGYDKDYLKQRADRLQAISLQEMNQFARYFIKPEQLTFFVLGPK